MPNAKDCDCGKHKCCTCEDASCQQKFTRRLDELRLEMQTWWGGSTTGTSRVNRLCEHLTRNAIIGENSELLQQQWFICGTKVLSTVKKYSKEIFSTKGNSQTGLGEQYYKNKPCSHD